MMNDDDVVVGILASFDGLRDSCGLRHRSLGARDHLNSTDAVIP